MNPVYRFIRRQIWKLMPPKVIWFNNHLFLLGRDESHLYYDLTHGKVYEPEELALICQIIKPGMVVADVGAHIGYITLLLAKLVGSTGKVYAFEPDPKNFRLLLKNIRNNGYQNIIPINYAVTDKTGLIDLYFSKHHNTDHRIYDIGDRKSIEILGVDLDSYLAHEPKIDFIKIDTQGAEGLVMKGAPKVMKKCRYLLTEFIPANLKAAGLDALEYVGMIKKAGFKTKQIGAYNLFCHK